MACWCQYSLTVFKDRLDESPWKVSPKCLIFGGVLQFRLQTPLPPNGWKCFCFVFKKNKIIVLSKTLCSSRLEIRSPAQAGIYKIYCKSYSQWPCWPESVEFGISNDANEGSVPFRVKKIPDAVVMHVGSLKALPHWKESNSKNTNKLYSHQQARDHFHCIHIERKLPVVTGAINFFLIRVYLHLVLCTRRAPGLLSNTSHLSACARQCPLGRQTTSLTTSPVLSPACLFHLRWLTLFEDSCTTHSTKIAIQ